MTLTRWLGPVIAVMLGLTPAPAWAQGNFEIQVYGSELTAPGQTMVDRDRTHTLHRATHRQDDPWLSVRPDGDAGADPVATVSAVTDRSEPRRSHHSG
jgi:hypothetical protein